MKIEKLYYFLSVAKHLNFTRAAQECPIAPPAISEQIRSREREWGVQLFERGARSIRLTAAGEVFYQHISRFVQNYEQSLREVRTSLQEKSLVIGVNHFNLPRLLSGAVRRLQERFPSIRVEYRNLFGGGWLRRGLYLGRTIQPAGRHCGGSLAVAPGGRPVV